MNNMNKTSVALAALSLSLLASAHAADTSPDIADKLAQQINQMQQQLDAMKQELARVKAQNDALAAAQAKAAAAPAPAMAPAVTAAPAPAMAISPNLGLWGYGEIYYTRPTKDKSRTQADLARAVFGICYKFDERTSFNSEFEVELAVSSADDAGEFEVEIKKRGQVSRVTYPYNPLDAVGWHGDLAPVKLNVKDLRPVTSQHLAAHLEFVGMNHMEAPLARLNFADA